MTCCYMKILAFAYIVKLGVPMALGLGSTTIQVHNNMQLGWLISILDQTQTISPLIVHFMHSRNALEANRDIVTDFGS